MRRFSACVFCALPSGHVLPYSYAQCRIYGHVYMLAIFTYIARQSHATALPFSLPEYMGSHMRIHDSAVTRRRTPPLNAAYMGMDICYPYASTQLGSHIPQYSPAHCLHLWIRLCADKHTQTHTMPLMRACIMYHAAHELRHAFALRTHIVSPRVPASGCTRSTRPGAGSLGAVRALSARSPAKLAPYLCAMRAIVSPGCATQ